MQLFVNILVFYSGYEDVCKSNGHLCWENARGDRPHIHTGYPAAILRKYLSEVSRQENSLTTENQIRL